MRPDKERIGRILISGKLLDVAMYEHENKEIDQSSLETLQLLMSKIIVLRAEFNYGNGCMEYTCFCPEFKPIAQAEKIPFYIVEFKRANNGIISICFEEENEYAKANIWLGF